jgi:hypothetical protein
MAVPGIMDPTTKSDGIPKAPTKSETVRTRPARLSSNNPKYALISPEEYQR